MKCAFRISILELDSITKYTVTVVYYNKLTNNFGIAYV